MINIPTKLEFGNPKHIKLARLGNDYAQSKAKLPLSLTIGSDTYECRYPCANCGLSNLESISSKEFRKKNVTERTKRQRLADVLYSVGMECRSCGTKHKIVKSDFSVRKIKIKDA